MKKTFGKQRIFSVVIISVILLVMLFSAFLDMFHNDHDCVTPECNLCYAIHISREVLKSLGMVLAASTIISYLHKEFSSNIYIKNIIEIPLSLFSLKVRLNN